MPLKLPKIGMRNIKTALSVLACFLIFLPFWGYGPQTAGGLIEISPFYACIAAVICTQSSVEQSLREGISRVIGTCVGGGLGLLVLLVDGVLELGVVTGLMLTLGVVATIWICNAIGRPAACSIACVVLCAITITHNGPDRYAYALLRVAETTVGIAVALGINYLLPNRRKKSAPEDKPSAE